MTPQEYIDRERHRAYMNLKRANERKDEKAAERLAEKLAVLKKIENGLEMDATRRTLACRLMRVAAKVLATVDSMDPDYSLLGMCELVNAWEGDRDD